MPLYLKLAIGNVRRSARDYSVYFITLGFAACLLYSFVGSTDHVRAMGLTSEQMGVLGSAGDILQAFSVFTVLVFLFLVRYANRFLLRRRKREFALYELYGMGRGAVSFVLVGETALVGAGARGSGVAGGGPARGGVGIVPVPAHLLHRVHHPHGVRWLLGAVAALADRLHHLEDDAVRVPEVKGLARSEPGIGEVEGLRGGEAVDSCEFESLVLRLGVVGAEAQLGDGRGE